jgi:hypothetical protein
LGRRTFCLLLRSRAEERLEVLTELLFLWGRQLGASPEEHGRCSEVLGGLFHDGTPMNVTNDAAMYFLHVLAGWHCRSLRVERVVEPCLLFLESLLTFVEASTLRLTVTFVLRGFLSSGGVRRSGHTFRGALVRVGGVNRVGLLLEDETVARRVVVHRRLLARSHALNLVATCLRCLRGDRACVSCGDGSSCPATGEPHLPLGIHRVIADLELITSQHFLLLQTENKHGGGERRKAEELLGWVRP